MDIVLNFTLEMWRFAGFYGRGCESVSITEDCVMAVKAAIYM